MPLFAAAQALPVCSWPLETTGKGISNVAYPDTNATYWTMPFDSVRWKSIVITGAYPQARFFSFVSYNASGSVVEDHGSLNDVDINPDPGYTKVLLGRAGMSDGCGAGIRRRHSEPCRGPR
jgi:hypothetical protein